LQVKFYLKNFVDEMEVDAARAKFAPEREGKYKKQAINSA
jgi:hypothetical protein